MMAILGRLIRLICVYSFALPNYCWYFYLALRSSGFNHQPSEREQNEVLLARDQCWNLSKTISKLYHRFFVLQDGYRLHYLTNIETTVPTSHQGSTLIVFVHGFPDSSLLWRHVTDSPVLQQNATLVAVDLPGTGGSDSFPKYGATKVLEALAEFILGMRERYLVEGSNPAHQGEHPHNQVIIVGHDWGCLLSYRLAAEAASGLADRYILTNGPYVPLMAENQERIVKSSKKMLLTLVHSPRSNLHCFPKAIYALRPLLHQLLLSGYIFAFQLPRAMIRWLGVVGNSSLPRLIHRGQYRFDKADYDPSLAMATSIGPGEAECRSQTSEKEPQGYGDSVLARTRDAGSWFVHFAGYYRDGVAFDEWEKSLTTLAAFYNIDTGNEHSHTGGSPIHQRRRLSSASSASFSDRCANELQAPATIIWGQKDIALTEEMCLQGISDHLCRGSQVVMLPETGHWTPLEKASRGFLRETLETLVQKGDIDRNAIQAVIQKTYPTAHLATDK